MQVILPDSRVHIDRAVLARHLLTSQTDPFTRSALRLEAVQPDPALRGRIAAWRSQHRR